MTARLVSRNVIADPLPDLNSVCWAVWVRVGSRDEPDGRAGATHFLEHVVAGTAHAGTTFSKVVDDAGGNCRMLTTPEYTVYSFTVPAKHWRRAWDALVQQLAKPDLTEANVEESRRQILSEIDAVADRHSETAHELALADLVGAHPLSRAPRGRYSEIATMHASTVARHAEHVLQSDQVSIVVSGAITAHEVGEAAHELLDQLSAGGGHCSERRLPVACPGVSRHRRHGRRSHVLASWLVPLDSPQELPPLGILNHLVGAAGRSVLRKLTHGGDAAYSMHSFRSTFSDCAVWTAQADCSPGYVDELMRIMGSAPADLLGRTGSEELTTAANALTGSLALALESTTMRANWLGRSWIDRREVADFETAARRLAEVRQNDLLHLIERMQGPHLTVIEGDGHGSS